MMELFINYYLVIYEYTFALSAYSTLLAKIQEPPGTGAYFVNQRLRCLFPFHILKTGIQRKRQHPAKNDISTTSLKE